jgi:hypothetical protein
MGKQAKLKKIRQQKANAKSNAKFNKKYEPTQFAEQFEKMGYQIKIDPRLQPKTNRGNIAPEIPREQIEPQL